MEIYAVLATVCLFVAIGYIAHILGCLEKCTLNYEFAAENACHYHHYAGKLLLALGEAKNTIAEVRKRLQGLQLRIGTDAEYVQHLEDALMEYEKDFHASVLTTLRPVKTEVSAAYGFGGTISPITRIRIPGGEYTFVQSISNPPQYPDRLKERAAREMARMYETHMREVFRNL